MDLPADVREVLATILAKDPEGLTPSEVAFLNARRDYLNNEQKRVFASVLKTPEQLHEEVVTAQAQEPVTPTPYVDEAGQPVTETVQEEIVAPQDNIPTEQVQTPVSGVAETPVAPEVPQQPEQPSQPLEATPEVVQEPVAPVEPAATEPVTPVENPYDVDTSEKDPDA